MLKQFPDAARIRVADTGNWVLILPDSTSQKGTAETPELALAAAEAARDRWILNKWNSGTWSKQANRRTWAVNV